MSLEEVTHRLRAAEAAAGRPPGSVRLIAVSKVQPPGRVAAVLNAGHRLFGENRVQDAAATWPDRKARFPGVELHLIGPLQTNKVRAAFGLFDTIQTLDRPKLAQAIRAEADRAGTCPRLFVQVNTGREAQKAGIDPDAAESFVADCLGMDLPVTGLMCIPPDRMDPAPHFTHLAGLAVRLGLPSLSMGMSGDFETAVRLGATHVRVGSAIFGERVAAPG
jgi:pyridoxal phosphate enzyme (YggS family)